MQNPLRTTELNEIPKIRGHYEGLQRFDPRKKSVKENIEESKNY